MNQLKLGWRTLVLQASYPYWLHFLAYILFQFSVKEVIFYHQNSRGVGPLVTNKEIITYIYTSIAALLYIPAVQGCVQFIDTLTDFSANLWQATRSLAKK
jgi:hypothetical protein